MVTQNTFFDKSWAAGLRRLLATKSELRFLVDLSPFGQLFFHAINTPCITVADVAENADLDSDCVAVLSMPPTDFSGLDEASRRKKATATVREAIQRGLAGKCPKSAGFACVSRVKRRMLAETAKDRWNLAPSQARAMSKKETLSAADVLDIRQGVTPGGCLEVFLDVRGASVRIGIGSTNSCIRQSRAARSIGGQSLGQVACCCILQRCWSLRNTSFYVEHRGDRGRRIRGHCSSSRRCRMPWISRSRWTPAKKKSSAARALTKPRSSSCSSTESPWDWLSIPPLPRISFNTMSN